MVDAAQIKEHADVVGSDGAHVGTVDHVDKGEIKLTKKDAAAGGLHHFIPLDFVQAVEGSTVRLDRSAEQVMREWSTSKSILARHVQPLQPRQRPRRDPQGV